MYQKIYDKNFMVKSFVMDMGFEEDIMEEKMNLIKYGGDFRRLRALQKKMISNSIVA